MMNDGSRLLHSRNLSPSETGFRSFHSFGSQVANCVEGVIRKSQEGVAGGAESLAVLLAFEGCGAGGVWTSVFWLGFGKRTKLKRWETTISAARPAPGMVIVSDWSNVHL
jgi:hypothetical protein